MYLALQKKKINMHLAIVYSTLLFQISYTQIFFIDGPLKDKFLVPPLYLCPTTNHWYDLYSS